MPRRRVAGARAQDMKVAELLEEIEWQRQRTVIAALLPYSGDNVRPRRPSSDEPSVVIPFQRKPTPGEMRVARAAHIARPTKPGPDLPPYSGGRW